MIFESKIFQKFVPKRIPSQFAQKIDLERIYIGFWMDLGAILKAQDAAWRASKSMSKSDSFEGPRFGAFRDRLGTQKRIKNCREGRFRDFFPLLLQRRGRNL